MLKNQAKIEKLFLMSRNRKNGASSEVIQKEIGGDFELETERPKRSGFNVEKARGEYGTRLFKRLRKLLPTHVVADTISKIVKDGKDFDKMRALDSALKFSLLPKESKVSPSVKVGVFVLPRKDRIDRIVDGSNRKIIDAETVR